MDKLHPYILEIIAQFWEFHKTDGANFYPIFHFANKKILVKQPGRHAKSTNEPIFFIGLFFAPIWVWLAFQCSVWSFNLTHSPMPIYYIRKIMFYGAIDMTAQTTRAKIAIGYRIGHLRVEEATSQHKNGYTIWLCRCDCGGEILLDTRTLQRGTITDCGCNTNVKPGQRDITGQRFGLLTAQYPLPARDASGSTVWHCICDCGGEIDAPLHQLTAGYRKSCGCLSHPPLKDYLGKRFSMLTITGYAGKEDGQHLWRCKCDCGKETVVRQTNLQSGKTKSCGCLQEKQLLENLKLCEGTSVTILEAGRRRLRPTNTSGVTGVYRNRRTGRWCAQITFKRKTFYLGAYEKKGDAIQARKRGEGLHENFIAWYYATHQLTEGRP